MLFPLFLSVLLTCSSDLGLMIDCGKSFMEISHRIYLPQNQQVNSNYSQDSRLRPASCFTFFLKLTNCNLTYGVCAWGNCALTFQRKIISLQKRALRLIYFSTSKKHTVPFFLLSNCFPLPSLFFRDCSYLLYDINRQRAPVSILNQVR